MSETWTTRRALVAASAAAGALGMLPVQSSAASSASSSALPAGRGSVSGAPNLPAGFADTFKSRYVDANGLRMHAVIGGKGRPLLLVHGWPQAWYQWRMVMPALARDFCDSGSWAGRRPRLGGYVTRMGPTDGATVSGGQGPQGNPVQFPDSHSIPTSIPIEFPRIDVSGRTSWDKMRLTRRFRRRLPRRLGESISVVAGPRFEPATC
jgi:hypothetical protein